MEDLFQIGLANFEFSSEADVVFEDGGMRFNLTTQPVSFDAALHKPAFDPEGVHNPRPGWIAPSFWTGVFFFYGLDTPTRLIHYPLSYSMEPFHLFEVGFCYGVRFFGEIEITMERIEIHGLMKHPYEDDAEGTPIHVIRNFPVGRVLLKPKTYTSVEEALKAPHERVLHLFWNQPWNHSLDRFPDDILRFRNLEFLSLQCNRPNMAHLMPIPDGLCDLRQLKVLNIRGADLEYLPERLGALTELRDLSITYGNLGALPDSIANLRKLERLTLTGNQLKALPESVGHLPSLKYLDIKDNPFESLPASLQNIENIKATPRLFSLFRDIRYRPEVEVAIDPEQFMARSSPDHVRQLSTVLHKHQLGQYETILLRHARQALCYRTTEAEDYSVKGNTRFGGAPDLPPDIAYPTTENGLLWHFCAQIDLEAITPLQPWLPRTGWLYFFVKDFDHPFTSLVLHSTAPRSELQTYVWPEDVEFADGSDHFTGFKATVEATVSLPYLYDAEHRFVGEDAIVLGIREDDSQQDSYWAAEEALIPRNSHLINSHVFTQHENPEEQAAIERGGWEEEWVNLLMLATDNNPGFCFWDAGTLTFTIHQKDLALGDFSRIFVSLESS